MTLPKFSIRELLMLTAIIALLLPYLYRNSFTAPRIDFSYRAIRAMIQSIEPKAKTSGGGGQDEARFSCLIPKSSTNAFVLALNAAFAEQIRNGGWSETDHGSKSINGTFTSFDYEMSNGSSRGAVHFYLLDRDADTNNSELERIEFVVVSLHVP